jgi:alpha-N-arabinofuranosidase
LKRVRIFAERNFSIGEVNPNLFGSFIEHLGRAVYTGIYEPGHPAADAAGFRTDVLELVKSLQIPVVRYPGGNFVSGYNWTDGIGPRASRPARLDLAWRTTETNQFGVDEFMDWAQKAHLQPMLAVNLGTGTPKEAGNLVEYCNHPGGTYWSDLRIKYGRSAPHGVKTWCLGNEMDGPWQICHLNADDYGKKALEAAKLMKLVDPAIELVACGSSSPMMPTFPEWDRTVLEYLYDQVDYISCHRYYENLGDINDFLGSYADMDRFIQTVIHTADYVKALKRSPKTLYISFDEWNVWYQKKVKLSDWETAPALLEDVYSLLDALVLGGLLCTLLNHADRVKIACLAQLVNVIAPIFTVKGGPAIKQTIFYPFQQVSTYGWGLVLKTIVTGPLMDTQLHGAIPAVHSAAVYNPLERTITIFALNCDREDAVELTAELRSFGEINLLEQVVLDGEDLFAVNNPSEPEKVKPRKLMTAGVKPGEVQVVLPKASWNMIRIGCKEMLFGV